MKPKKQVIAIAGAPTPVTVPTVVTVAATLAGYMTATSNIAGLAKSLVP